MRTAVHIDGYNLYYGRLRETPHKWLDIVELFDHIVRIQDPTSSVEEVTFYTAHALGGFARHGAASVAAQGDYHRALANRHPDRFKLKLGTHSCDKSGTWLPTFLPGQRYDRTQRSQVWKLEEKQTDVNLALGLYRDARRGAFDQLVICCNDSDQVPTLRAIKEDFPDLKLGVVLPRPAQEAGRGPHRLSQELSSVADWARQHILDEELVAAQLPAQVPTKKKPARKPAHW